MILKRFAWIHFLFSFAIQHMISQIIGISRLIFWDQKIYFKIWVVLHELELRDIENGCIKIIPLSPLTSDAFVKIYNWKIKTLIRPATYKKIFPACKCPGYIFPPPSSGDNERQTNKNTLVPKTSGLFDVTA